MANDSRDYGYLTVRTVKGDGTATTIGLQSHEFVRLHTLFDKLYPVAPRGHKITRTSFIREMLLHPPED